MAFSPGVHPERFKFRCGWCLRFAILINVQSATFHATEQILTRAFGQICFTSEFDMKKIILQIFSFIFQSLFVAYDRSGNSFKIISLKVVCIIGPETKPKFFNTNSPFANRSLLYLCVSFLVLPPSGNLSPFIPKYSNCTRFCLLLD